MNDKEPTGHAFIYPLFKEMIGKKINFGFRGTFTREVSDGLIEFARGIFRWKDVAKKLRKRVVYILVECVQNISRHQELTGSSQTAQDGIFLIQSMGNVYSIAQGNIIMNDQVQPLEERLERINRMGRDELKEQYASVLSGSGFSKKGGAGLGLIEIARKSGNRIRYRFSKVNEEYSYFFMDTLINEQGSAIPDEAGGNFDPDVTERFLTILRKNKVNLIYCSQFTGQKAFDLIGIIENLRLVGDRDILVRKRIFIVLVELLQNIHHHAAESGETGEKTGILLLGADPHVTKIATGNLIRNDEVEPVLTHFDHLNSLDRKGLEALYKEKLGNRDFSEPTKNGIGLVDLLLKSGHPIIYKCIRVDERRSFLSIEIIVNN